MIQAVIFDCFGVLTTDAWLPFKMRYFGQDPALFERASELNKQSDAGFISNQDFVQSIAELAGLSVTEVGKKISNKGNIPNSELFEYVEQLKADYKIGLLSNAAGNWLPDLFEPAQLALFDAMALSYDTHFTKPMPEAYQAIADRLGVAVGNCVFIDDQERFAVGAEAAGMAAIWYQDNQQLKRDLTALLTDSKD